jgi:hypothetical protein
MSRFPSDAHLVSWAKFCPQVHESAGRRKNKGRGKGSPWLAAILGNIAATAGRTDSFLGARYRLLARRRGKQKAIVAVGNSVLVIAYHLLSDPPCRSTTWAPTTTRRGSTRNAERETSPPNSKPSPDKRSSSATARPPSSSPCLSVCWLCDARQVVSGTKWRFGFAVRGSRFAVRGSRFALRNGSFDQNRLAIGHIPAGPRGPRTSTGSRRVAGVRPVSCRKTR